MTDAPRRPDDESPPDLVDRGPVETLAPSRTAIVLVAVAGLAIAILAGVGALNVEGGRSLGDDEQLLEAGQHDLVAGPVTLSADLPGDWVARDRCPRWLQLSDAADDATTLHLIWLDAVPLPSDAPDVELVATPEDVPALVARAARPAGAAAGGGHPRRASGRAVRPGRHRAVAAT